MCSCKETFEDDGAVRFFTKSDVKGESEDICEYLAAFQVHVREVGKEEVGGGR